MSPRRLPLKWVTITASTSAGTAVTGYTPICISLGRELARWEAVAHDSTVQIDTGLVWLDAPTAEKLVALTQSPAVTGASLNLYGDLLIPLSGSTELEQYLADPSDGPATRQCKPRATYLGADARHTVQRRAAPTGGLHAFRAHPANTGI